MPCFTETTAGTGNSLFIPEAASSGSNYPHEQRAYSSGELALARINQSPNKKCTIFRFANGMLVRSEQHEQIFYTNDT